MAKKMSKKKLANRVEGQEGNDMEVTVVDNPVELLRLYAEAIESLNLGDMTSQFSKRIRNLSGTVLKAAAALEKSTEVKVRSDAKKRAVRQRLLDRAAKYEGV